MPHSAEVFSIPRNRVKKFFMHALQKPLKYKSTKKSAIGFKLNISSISHRQAIAEHWDLPNAEIFQSIKMSLQHNITV
jgi:hypothetical protein